MLIIMGSIGPAASEASKRIGCIAIYVALISLYLHLEMLCWQPASWRKIRKCSLAAYEPNGTNMVERRSGY